MRRPLYQIASLTHGVSLSWLIEHSQRYVICPYYHVVSNESLPYIKHLYTYRDVDTFCRDLDFLQRHFQPISWREISMAEENKLPSFCLTFDDGLQEIYTTIAPILKERNIPAVFFLNSDFVDNRDFFYRYKVSLIIEEGMRRGKDRAWKKKMLSVPFEKQGILDGIASSLGIDCDRYFHDHTPYLTYLQIRELQQMGFEFGGHSVNHPHMYKLSEEEQTWQVETCMAQLRQHLQLPDSLFAYPFGQENLTASALRGLQEGMDTVFGTNNMEIAERPLFNRIWMEGTAYSGEDIIRGEYLRTILKQQIR